MLTANDDKSVKAQMKNLAIYLEQRPEAFEMSLMTNLAYTLGQRRSMLPWRVAASATSGADLIRKLSSPSLSFARTVEQPRLGFIFTGQGAQWHAMGRELMRSYPVFASTIEVADDCLVGLGAQWSLTSTE